MIVIKAGYLLFYFCLTGWIIMLIFIVRSFIKGDDDE